MRGPWIGGLALLVVSGASGASPPPDAAAPGQTCVDVTIGADRSYGCLNATLERMVAQAHRHVRTTLPGVDSPPAAIGLFSDAAVHEHLGANYGRSAFPPPVPRSNAVNPLFPR